MGVFAGDGDELVPPVISSMRMPLTMSSSPASLSGNDGGIFVACLGLGRVWEKMDGCCLLSVVVHQLTS